MWSLCKKGEEITKTMLTDIHGLNVWAIFISLSFASCPNCQLDILDLHRLLITDTARWDGERRGDERCTNDRDAYILGWSVLNPLAQCPTFAVCVCVCVCKCLNVKNCYVPTRAFWLLRTHDGARVCDHKGWSCCRGQSCDVTHNKSHTRADLLFIPKRVWRF